MFKSGAKALGLRQKLLDIDEKEKAVLREFYIQKQNVYQLARTGAENPYRNHLFTSNSKAQPDYNVPTSTRAGKYKRGNNVVWLFFLSCSSGMYSSKKDSFILTHRDRRCMCAWSQFPIVRT